MKDWGMNCFGARQFVCHIIWSDPLASRRTSGYGGPVQTPLNCDWIGLIVQAARPAPVKESIDAVFVWWLLWRWLLFLVPGLGGWVITVVMVLRGKGGRGVAGLQFVFVLLIAVGSMTFFIFEVREQAGWTLAMGSDSIDPWIATKDLYYSTTTALLGIGIHLSALVISLAIAPRAWRRDQRQSAIAALGRES
ncbi:MAG: hypothetical protein NTW21_32845 [Verrucomicrobia bacterium]|nr:hypothetical protein [Verrucomicrobiota bacterium]